MKDEGGQTPLQGTSYRALSCEVIDHQHICLFPEMAVISDVQDPWN